MTNPDSDSPFTVEITRRSIWTVIFAVLIALIGVWVFFQARHLIGMLIVSLFFSLALEPAVTYLHQHRGWKRGAAVGVIYLAGFVSVFVLVLFLLPVAYAVIYQQIENYWLSPRISSKTMELNGALAFGSALAGGAIAGPMGAFMALPVAALITAFISNYRHHYDVVYASKFDDDEPPEAE